MAELLAVILTRDEALHIEACIRNLRDWVDGVLVWDSGSVDGTPTLARQAGAWVVHRPFDDYARQRQAVLDTVDATWILFVDADERATPALAREIRTAIHRGEAVGYWIPRRNMVVGREVRGAGFWPDYQLRLLRRDRATYDLARPVHEVVHLDGPAGHLREPLLHLNYRSWAQFHRKQRRYAAYEARILARRGLRPRPHNFVLQPWREFRRRFVALAGWQDGLHGLRLSLLLAWYYGFMPYWILWRNGP